jgi:hypothetical protein
MRFQNDPQTRGSKKVVAGGIAAALTALLFAVLGNTLLRRQHPRGEFAEFASGTGSRSQARRAIRSFEQPKNVAFGLGSSRTPIQQ